jgi:hypothetical protein
MKFLYLDETGTDGQSDNVIVAGICVDAYRLNTTTRTFDELYQKILKECDDCKAGGKKTEEVKTHALIAGKNTWKKVCLKSRKKFLINVCQEATKQGTIFANAVSVEKFKNHQECFNFPDKDEWDAATMFLVGSVQRLGQKEQKNKGQAVFIVDENAHKRDSLRNTIRKNPPWYNALYYTEKPTPRSKNWKQPKGRIGLDQIINSGFFTKSEHSSLIQVADAIAKIYSLNLELKAGKREDWTEQTAFFENCVAILDKKREKFPRKLDSQSECVKFYKAIAPCEWEL